MYDFFLHFMVRHSSPPPLGTLVGNHIAGDGKGKKIGFPTINLAVSSSSCPEDTGVFLGCIRMQQESYFGLVHIGPRPTFGKPEIRTEVFLFDYTAETSPEISPDPLTVELLEKIREVQYFETSSALVRQIEHDCAKAKKIISTF